ncbi:MAG: acetate--CoA ligase family protein [Gammaproteobacteria bacterium]
MNRRRSLKKLLRPAHIAVIGGGEAAEMIRQCDRIGFSGQIWPVHPTRGDIDGRPCFRSVTELPQAPDAAFVAVPREVTVDVVRELSARGAGGAVCYASGFAEYDERGKRLQQELVAAAGDMPIVGPNCYGFLNYLDGAALWPDQHGGARLERGVAIVTQSGNMGLNMTMQRRSLPLAYLISVGNKASIEIHDYVDALLDDERITAVGLHIEGLSDTAAFSQAAVRALRKRVPLVALKAGSSELGAQTALSHTSSLAGADALYDALFERVGVARVRTLPAFLETLKFLSVIGPLPGKRIASISCSGGEASMVADLAKPLGLELPAVSTQQASHLRDALGPMVAIANPLDYHTFIWGDADAQQRCFGAMMRGDWDVTLMVFDYPHAETCDDEAWQWATDAFIAAQKDTRARAVIVSSLPECLPVRAREKLAANGVAPMQGVEECLIALRAAAEIGERQREAGLTTPINIVASVKHESHTLDEWQSKQVLRELGIPVPDGRLVVKDEAALFAREIGFPVVVKAVARELVHKTEAGAVRPGLRNEDEVAAAVAHMQSLSDQFLVESFYGDAVAELIVGVSRDPQFGPVLVVGSGGVLVELMADAKSLLLPVSQDTVANAIGELRAARLLTGYRSRPKGDIAAVVSAVMAVARYAQANANRLYELDINPLLVLPEGQGVVAVDAVIRLTESG